MVTGSVSRHTGFDTLILQTQAGVINAASGVVLSVANLALQAGIGIGTTGAIAIDATHLAFASQSGAIQLSDSNAVTLTSVGPVSASSIPGDVFSAAKVGDSFTLLHTGGGVTGQITYNGQCPGRGRDSNSGRREPLPHRLHGEWRSGRDTHAHRKPDPTAASASVTGP